MTFTAEQVFAAFSTTVSISTLLGVGTIVWKASSFKANLERDITEIKKDVATVTAKVKELKDNHFEHLKLDIQNITFHCKDTDTEVRILKTKQDEILESLKILINVAGRRE